MDITTTTIQAPARAPTLADIPAEWSVQVTDEDLLLGWKGNGYHCAVARAVKREAHLRGWLPHGCGASIGVYNADIYQPSVGGDIRRWDHDGENLIDAFDEGKPVQPREVRFWTA